jgi:hypothetical protein
MKKISTVLFLALLTTTNVVADMTKVGVGVGLNGGSGQVVIPMDFDNQLRVEPEVGINYTSDDDISQTQISLKTGIYLMQEMNNKVNVYYGGKVGFLISNTENDYYTTNNNTFELTPTAGFEYYLNPQVSIGGEVGFAFAFGDTTTIATVTTTSLRYYFN